MKEVQCPLHPEKKAKLWGLEYKGHSIVKCDDCQIRFVSPRRKEVSNKLIYESHYFSKNERDERAPTTLSNRLNHCLKAFEFLYPSLQNKDGSILDIGAGTGLFLKTASLLGHEKLLASDISNHNAPMLQNSGINFYHGDITTEKKYHGQFELISAQHVLEHVMDPNSFLSGLKKLLTPSGILYLVVPNEGSLTSQGKSFLSRFSLSKKPFKHLSPGHHLFFFEQKTLKKLLKKNGLQVLHTRTKESENSKGAFRSTINPLISYLGLNSWIEVLASASP